VVHLSILTYPNSTLHRRHYLPFSLFSSVISHVIRLENSISMQTNAKLMDEPQQLVMTDLGAVLLLFVDHHIQAVRSIVRSHTLLEFFV
jgi:hypothetical protein